MTATRIYILCRLVVAGLLMTSCFSSADSGTGQALTVAEYRTELDQLLATAQQLDSSGRSLPEDLKDLPPSWRVRTGQQDFEISTEGLRRDVHRYTEENDSSTASAIRSRIENLRSDLDGFEAQPLDVENSRAHLAALLARPEFRNVRGPTFLDRLAQRLIGFLLSLLELLFRSSAIPTISKFFVYGLIVLAVLTLGYVAYRQIQSAGERANVIPTELAVSAKGWALWLADAHAAGAQNNWREAIHLAYWAGISFLEEKGLWRPDRARTPREYLRLVSNSSEYRETLTALTQVFELAWYAKREANAEAFAQTMQALERLGCHSS